MIKGSIAAIVTPFLENGEIDFDCYGRIIEFHIKHGSNGLVVLGTTGEAPTVNDDESAALVSYAVRTSHGRIPIIAGCGFNDTARAKKRCVAAERMGADAILLLTPYYNKANYKGMTEHFTMCADSVNIPIIIYNVPSRTGCSLTVEQIAELKNHRNISGIKEASGNMSFLTKVCALADDDFAVYCGCDDINVPALSVGAVGIISVLANILPKECREMTEHMEKGNIALARAMQHRYGGLISALFSEVNPIPIKTALNILSFKDIGNVGSFRLPMCEMGAEAREKLEKELLLVAEDLEKYR